MDKEGDPYHRLVGMNENSSEARESEYFNDNWMRSKTIRNSLAFRNACYGDNRTK